MSKFSKAINKSKNERSEMSQNRPKRKAKKSVSIAWIYWVVIIGGVVTVLFAFNSTSDQDSIPLSEIFPDEEIVPMDIEYEFVQEQAVPKASEDSIAASQNNEAEFVNLPVDTASVPKALEEESKVEITAAPDPVATPQPEKTQPVAKKEEAPAQVETTISSATNFESIPFTIQVASFRDAAKANEALKKMEAKKYPAYVVKRDLGPKGVWHRIYVGRYQTKTEAQQSLVNLDKDYQGSFIISPKK